MQSDTDKLTIKHIKWLIWLYFWLLIFEGTFRKWILPQYSDVILVIGSDNSSNSNRLVEVARSLGTPAYLIDDETDIRSEWLKGRETVGVTSGASAPEWLVERVVADLKARGASEVRQLHTVDEQMRFSLPVGIREPVG